MADAGLTKAIRAAVSKGAKGARVMRPAEEALLKKGEATGLAQAAAPPVEAPAPNLGAVAPEVAPATVAPAPSAAAPEGAIAPTPAPAGATPSPAPLGNADPVPPPVPRPKPMLDELPPQAPLGDVDVAATRLSKVTLGDYALDETFQTNFDTITSTDGVKGIIAEVAQQNAGRIDEARRQTITNVELQRLADDLDVQTDVVTKIMSRESGGILNAETILAARQVLNSSAERVQTLAKKISAGQATDLERIQFRRQLQFHGDFQTQFMGARAEAGRALNAFSIPTGATPDQISRMKEVVEGMNGNDTDALARVLSEVNTTSGVSKLARKYQASRVSGALVEVFVNSILSGPRTHVVNLMGGAVFQAMNVAETAVAARIGRFLSGEEHVIVGEASSMLHGTVSAVRDGFRLAAIAMRKGASLDDIVKFDGGANRTITAQNYLPPTMRSTPLGAFVDGLGHVIRAPTERVMVPTDEFMKTLAYRAELERAAYAHVYKEVVAGNLNIADAERAARDFMENSSLSAQEAADMYARYTTFQDPLGPVGRKIEGGLRAVPSMALVVPFIRTPIKIFLAGVAHRSPLAVFSADFRAAVKRGGRDRDMALARVTMGSLTAAWVATEVVNGGITGGGPTDDAARQLLIATGWQPYSIRYRDPVSNEDKYVSYARLEPLAFVIGAVADTTEILSYINSVDPESLKDEESQMYDAIAAIVAGIANNTMSKTFMRGIADFAEMTSDPRRYVEGWMANMATAIIPYSSFRRQGAQLQDPYMREAWTLTDKIRVASGIPGYSKDMPPRRDIFGEPRVVAAGDLVGPMSPLPTSIDKGDPVAMELVRLMEDTKRVAVGMPNQRIEGMKLTAPEYDELIRYGRLEPNLGGKTFKEALEAMMNSPGYLAATPDTQVDLIKNLQRQADDVGRSLLELENPSFAERMSEYRLKKERRNTGL